MFFYFSTKKLILISGIVILILGTILTIFVAFETPNFRERLIQEKNKPARFVTDRNGRILRYLPDERGCFNVWKNIQDVPDILIQAVITAEDHNFFYHPGFDPLAIGRAIYTNFKTGRIISGASTISQQVVRLLNPRPRTYCSKANEFLESLKLEYQLSKREILELYLNLVPMGGQLRGAGIASLFYFHKDLSSVGVCEVACLAIIPRAPTRLDPNRPMGRKALLANADKLVHNMARSSKFSSGFIKDADTKCMVSFYPRNFPRDAAHFVDYALIDRPQVSPEIQTTLDLDLQRSIEKILKSHASRLRGLGISQCAAVVVGTEGREILAMIGSLNYTEEALGYNNGAISYRSAGSTLKPFLYALALSKGYSDSSEIPDTLRNYKGTNGDYIPLNANRTSYGPVSLRLALGNSLNLPAIKMIQQVTVDDFYSVLQRLGLISERVHGPVENYGLGLSIGAIEVRLYDLVQAYACLAGGGMFQSLRMKRHQLGHYERIFSESVTSQITDILEDPLARILTFGNPTYFDFGFPVAIKTGTSSNYRDAWAVAYTSKYVIGIWAGNFNGTSTGDALGGSSCGPIIKETLNTIYSGAPSNLQDKFSNKGGISCTHVMKPNTRRLPDRLPREDDPMELSSRHEHVYLGPAYARWIYRREKEQGLSRFRLQEPVKKSESQQLALDSGGVGLVNTYTRDKPAIEIINPHDGDRFVVTDSSLKIPFRALPSVVVENIIWFIDGKEVERTPPPYEFFWTPFRGEHSVIALTPFNDAASIKIHVE